MRYQLFLLISILFLDGFLWGCKESTSPTNAEIEYLVQKIDGLSVEEFTKRIGDYDWPLIIKLKKSQLAPPFKGSVKLANLGWQKIDGNCTQGKCFVVNTKSKLGPVESIVFSDIEITATELTGKYSCSGPLIDTPAHEFTAKLIL